MRQHTLSPGWPEKGSFLLLAILIVVSPLLFGLVEAHRRPLVGLVAGLLLFSWSVQEKPGCPQREARAALLAGMGLILIAAFQLIPLSPGVLSVLSPRRADLLDRLRQESSGVAAFAPLVGATGWLPGVSWEALSANPEATRRSLLMLGALLVIGAATALLAKSGRTARGIALCVVAIGTFEALYGLAEYLSGHQQIFGYRKRHYIHMVTGSYINKNHFAGLMEIALPLAVGMYWDSARAGRHARSFRSWIITLSDAGRGAGRLLLLAAGLMASALLLSFSRSGITFCALAVAGMFLWLGWRQRGASLRLALTLVTVLVILAPLAWFGRNEIVASFSRLPSQEEEAGGRVDTWRSTLALIKDYPLLGAGLGTFEDVFPHYVAPSTRLHFDHAHNDYLEFASGIGTPAALAGVVVVLWLLITALSASASAGAHAGLLAGGVAGVFALVMHEVSDFNLTIPANAVLFSVCLGLVVGVARASDAGEEMDRPAALRFRVAAGLAACLMLMEASTEYLAAECTRRSSKAARMLDGAATTPAMSREPLRLARLATFWRPGDSTAQRQRVAALAALAQQRLELGGEPVSAAQGEDVRPPGPAAVISEMGGAALAAIRANPWDATAYPLVLKTLDLSALLRPKDPRLSSEAVLHPVIGGVLETIVWLAPNLANAHRARADYLLASGDLVGAAASYRRVLEVDPVQIPSVVERVSDFVVDSRWIDGLIPPTAEAMLRYGDLLASRGEVTRAEKAYRDSLGARVNLDAVLHLDDLYRTSCRSEMARHVARQALAGEVITAPAERAELQYDEARSLLRSGDRQAAMKALEAAVASYPQRLQFQYALASLVAEERPAEAVRSWKDLLERNRASPDLPHFRADIYLGLARAYEKEGFTLEALREYRHVLIDRPNDESVLARITLLERGER